MKNLLYLGIILMLASCGSNESETALSTVNMDGKEDSIIRIGNLEVMTEDLGKMKMNWDEAKKACKNLGDGWRLPTRSELNLLYENKKIGGFTEFIYWSSTEYANYGAWQLDFQDGWEGGVIKDKNDAYVRAVRAF